MNFNVGTIGVVIIAISILGFLYWRKRTTERGQEEIKEFLNTLYSDFEVIILEYIEKTDIINVDNVIIVEQEIVNDLIDTLWNKAMKALEEYITDPINKAILKKLLVREKVEEFIKQIFEESIKVQKKYTAKYNSAIVEANREAILLEAGVVKLNEEIDKNIPEDFREVDDIDPNKIINISGEVVEQEINPPHDEEVEEVDPEDDSIDILE